MVKHTAMAAEIRQLCCLGLPGQEVMPLLLQTLHRFIPSFTNLFDWVDEDCRIVNYYSEGPDVPEAARLYFEEFYNKREREVIPAFSEQVRNARGVINSEPISSRAFFRSDFYNQIWRPRGTHHRLEAIIREHDRPVGSLVLYRGAGEAQFCKREEQALAGLIPHISHAVASGGNYAGEYASSDETGLVILDSRGKVLHLSPEGRRLLSLATHPRVDPQTIVGASDALPLPPPLSRLCFDLTDTFQGKDSPPPVSRHRNGWGKFVFRAHWLEPCDNTGKGGLIGVNIERQVPLALAVVQSLQSLPLSARQKEFCLLLAQGLSYPDIAKRMHVSKHTAVSYARTVYDKLGLGGREDLLKALRSPPPNG